ncbi:hypothetical protein GCM10027346_25460 [Hymenobacter seoulensis]
MRKQLLFLPLLLGVVSAYAQTNFRPGYVLPLSGDTLRGEVDSRSERRNSIMCRFRPAAGAEVTEYKPEQLRAYGFTQARKYQTRLLPTAARSAAFVQVLVDGPLSLYHFTNEDDKELYYAQKGIENALLPLVQRDTTILQYNQQTRSQTKVQNRVYLFRNTLWSVMADCPKVQSTLTRTELTESQLMKVVSAYNECVGGQQSIAPTAKSKMNLQVFGGGFQAKVNYNFDGERELSSSMRPTFGAGVQVHPSRFNYHLSLVGQALYVQQKYATAYTGNGTLGPGYKRTASIEFSSVRIPLLMRYSLTKSVIRPYIQAGPVFALNMGRDAYRTDHLERFSAEPTVTPIDLRSYGIGGTIGVGVAIPAGAAGYFNLEARADRFDNTSEETGVISGSTGLSLLAGFTFGK